MGLLEQAKEDIEDITSNTDEWGVSMTFTSPDSETCTVTGTHAKTQYDISPDTGKRINTKKANASVSEKFFNDEGYAVRNAAGEVHLEGHRVDVADSTGQSCSYVVRESYADETIGLIVCILGDFE